NKCMHHFRIKPGKLFLLQFSDDLKWRLPILVIALTYHGMICITYRNDPGKPMYFILFQAKWVTASISAFMMLQNPQFSCMGHSSKRLNHTVGINRMFFHFFVFRRV